MFFFFFQAEDGIRDIGVTGVQTCALPILTLAPACIPTSPQEFRRAAGWDSRDPRAAPLLPRLWRFWGWRSRSGEGRVGEEGRSLGSADHLKKKKNKYIGSISTYIT